MAPCSLLVPVVVLAAHWSVVTSEFTRVGTPTDATSGHIMVVTVAVWCTVWYHRHFVNLFLVVVSAGHCFLSPGMPATHLLPGVGYLNAAPDT
jgi:hypothetical protein